MEPCTTSGDGCVDVRTKSLMIPFNGYIVYGVAHQHAGGLGAALYRAVTLSSFTTFCFNKIQQVNKKKEKP